jgi:hypothetical protein
MTAPDDMKLKVSASDYAAFERGLPQLGRLAKKERLGIWK